MDPDPDGEDKEPYPLLFHPLGLGEDALRALPPSPPIQHWCEPLSNEQ